MSWCTQRSALLCFVSRHLYFFFSTSRLHVWERKVAMPACWLTRGVYKGAGPALEPPREAYSNAC